MSKEKTLFPVTEVSPSGIPKWDGGSWCIVWVYSDKGNFMLKGFQNDCNAFIKEKGWKCWAVFNLYHGKLALTNRTAHWRRPSDEPGFRTFIETYNCNFRIYPSYNREKSSRRRGKLKAKDFKYSIYVGTKFSFDKQDMIQLKRLPTKFTEFNF